MVNFKSLICANQHCFDISKQGYVNMLSRALKVKYDKQMFKSRKIIFKSGFFDPLIEKISQKIIDEIKIKEDRIKILDAGCGEGSFLSGMKKKLFRNNINDLLGVGVDISKDGISMASKEYPNNIWCVADIAKCPFESKQFNLIFNILSPSNYYEFRRLLYDDGIIIKVIPESNYLQELRQIFYAQTGKQVYSNDKTVALFKNNLVLLDIQRLQYSVAIDSNLIEHLVYMTPLSWGSTEERLQKVLRMNLRETTIDLSILFGK
jgi:23S rRNA (guanine745-N1)-methyltransferase